MSALTHGVDAFHFDPGGEISVAMLHRSSLNNHPCTHTDLAETDIQSPAESLIADTQRVKDIKGASYL